MDWEIHQINIKATFFNEELDVEIYMDQPQEFVQKNKKHLVCKLHQILYGLKQLPRMWYRRIDLFFINKDFSRSQTDHLLYVKQMGKFLLVVIFYVGGLMIFTSKVVKLKGSNQTFRRNLK